MACWICRVEVEPASAVRIGLPFVGDVEFCPTHAMDAIRAAGQASALAMKAGWPADTIARLQQASLGLKSIVQAIRPSPTPKPEVPK